MTTTERVQQTVERMKDGERQRYEAGEMPGHVLCTCGHVLRVDIVDYHKAVSFLHPQDVK